MRTAVIIKLDAKGVPSVIAHGLYDKTKAEAGSVISKLKFGEAAWVITSGFAPKIFKGPKEKPHAATHHETKKEHSK